MGDWWKRRLTAGKGAARAVPACCAIVAVIAGGAAWFEPPAVPPRAASVPVQRAPGEGFHHEWVERLALNMLLVPLLDDSQPPRWSEAALSLYCGPGTRVLVDGRPMQPNEEIPRGAFSLRWDMDACGGPAPEEIEFSGSVDLLVFHEEEGLSALVSPAHLRVQTMQGALSRMAPFVASARLGS